MTYKGYSARIDYDNDDHIFVGRIVGIQDGVNFHGETVTELETAFREAVDGYLDVCARVGKAPQKAYTGNLTLRVSPDSHSRAAMAAELAGKSLNQWSEEVLLRAAMQAGHEGPLPVTKAARGRAGAGV